jgi:gliding motility-associated-like protein
MLFISILLGVLMQGSSAFSQNVVLNFNTDFTWKALSATPNGGFVANGGSNAWMFNSYNAASWPNAVAGSWAIAGAYDLPAIQHIWNNAYNDSVLLRKEFVVPVADSYTGSIQSQVDNQYSLFFNGTLLGAGSYSPTPVANYNIAPSLQGCVNNVVAMEALNWGGPYGAKMAITITAINVLNSPVANPATNITCAAFTAHWDTVSTANLYLLDVSTDPLFGSFYSVYHDYNMGNATSLNLTSLPGPGPYYYRLRAQRTNASGLRVSCYSNVITVNLSTTSPVNAGVDAYICPGSSTNLNGSGPGTVSWTPATGLSATNILNPVATPATTTTYTLTLTNGGCVVHDSVILSIANIPPLDLTNDTSVCPGNCVNLGVSGADYYVWAPYPGMVDSSLSMQAVCPLVNTTYSVTAYTVGPNIITNGNFSGGNTGFSSSYNFAFPNTLEGQYYVGPNPQAWNGGMSPCGDHTSGSGNMLMVNGSPVPNTSIWCQTVPVSTNTDYLFSTWVTPAYIVNMPALQFSINGVPLGSTFSPGGPTCNWEEFFSTWNSGVNTTANICIVNQNTNASGNDFALDDISFSPVCTQTGSVDVAINSVPAPAANNTGPYCTGDTIQLNSPSGSVTDDWTGPAAYIQNNQQNPSILNATLAMDGIYTVTVTNAAGCSATATTTVAINSGLVANAGNTGPYCAGDSIHLNSNTVAANYDWTGPASYAQNGQNQALANATTAMNGLYTVLVTSAGGCTGTATTNVQVSALPAVNANANTPVCEGLNFTLTGSGASSYDWTGPNAYSVLNNASPVINSSAMVNAGVYTVTGTDINGCSATSTVTAVIYPTPTAGFTSDVTTGCVDLCVHFSDNSTITGSAIVGWDWNIESQNPMAGSNGTICFSNNGLYDVALTVTSTEGCTATSAVVNYINAVAMPVASYTYAPQVITETDPMVSFVNTSFAATSYAWNLGDGATSLSVNVQHTYADTGIYCVNLLASNALGCVDTITHCLVVNPVFSLYIPNSFTPNDDGLNEQFMVYGKGVKTLDAIIYDRWGEEIYHFSDILKGWPGHTQAGSYCEMGSYVYKIYVVDVQNNDYEYHGKVNLIR